MKSDIVRVKTCISCGAQNITIKGETKDGTKYVCGAACKHEDGRVVLTRSNPHRIIQKRDSSKKHGFVFETDFGIFESMTEACSVRN